MTDHTDEPRTQGEPMSIERDAENIDYEPGGKSPTDQTEGIDPDVQALIAATREHMAAERVATDRGVAVTLGERDELARSLNARLAPRADALIDREQVVRMVQDYMKDQERITAMTQDPPMPSVWPYHLADRFMALLPRAPMPDVVTISTVHAGRALTLCKIALAGFLDSKIPMPSACAETQETIDAITAALEATP